MYTFETECPSSAIPLCLASCSSTAKAVAPERVTAKRKIQTPRMIPCISVRSMESSDWMSVRGEDRAFYICSHAITECMCLPRSCGDAYACKIRL